MNRVQVPNPGKNLTNPLKDKINNKKDYSLINLNTQSEVLPSSSNHHHQVSTPSRNELNLQSTTMQLHADVHPPNHTHPPVQMAKTQIHVPSKSHAKSPICSNTLTHPESMQVEIIIPSNSTPQSLYYQDLPLNNAKNSSKQSEKIPTYSNIEKPKNTPNGQPSSFSPTNATSSNSVCPAFTSTEPPPYQLDRIRSNMEGDCDDTC